MAELGCELEAFKPPKAKAMAKKAGRDGGAKVPGDGCHGQVQVEFSYI